MSYNKVSSPRYVSSVFISYLMFLLLTLLISAVVLKMTVFDAGYMVSCVDSSGFSEAALEEVGEIFVSHGAASGIPQEVMLQALTQRRVDNTIKAAIIDSYNNAMGTRERDLLEEELFGVFRQYALEQGAEDTASLDEGLRDLAQLCASDFEAYLVSPAIFSLAAIVVRYNWLLTFTIVATALFVLILALLLRLQSRRVSRLAGAYIHAIGATTLVCALIPASVLGLGLSRRLNVAPPSWGRLINAWIDGIARGYLYAIIPLTLILSTFAVIWVWRRRRRRRLGR